MVGAVRFELTTSWTRTKRASHATLRPGPKCGRTMRKRTQPCNGNLQDDLVFDGLPRSGSVAQPSQHELKPLSRHCSIVLPASGAPLRPQFQNDFAEPRPMQWLCPSTPCRQPSPSLKSLGATRQTHRREVLRRILAGLSPCSRDTPTGTNQSPI